MQPQARRVLARNSDFGHVLKNVETQVPSANSTGLLEALVGGGMLARAENI